MNKKQIVVTGPKDMVNPVVIFSTCITWMIVRREELTKTLTFQTIVEFFKYVLEQLKTKQIMSFQALSIRLHLGFMTGSS
ncbi:MAG: hypothetical protein WCC17_16390 [Candidatus Nitrosopolaris sp.]